MKTMALKPKAYAVFAGFLCLALAGCVAPTVYHAAGIPEATRDADLARCTARALAAHPVALVERQRPPTFIPASETCDRRGTCTRTEAYWEPGETYTTDLNEAARAAATGACMGQLGYRAVDLPYCAAGDAVRQSATMPTLSAQTCLLRQDPAPARIVTALP